MFTSYKRFHFFFFVFHESHNLNLNEIFPFLITKLVFFSGPSIDMTLRRTQLAADDLMTQACRKPKELRVVKKKNISRDVFGAKHGRIHMGKQDVSRLQTRKMKGLKKTPEEKKQIRMEKKKAARAAVENGISVEV